MTPGKLAVMSPITFAEYLIESYGSFSRLLHALCMLAALSEVKYTPMVTESSTKPRKVIICTGLKTDFLG